MDIIGRVKELIGIMTSNDLSELEVEQPELKIKIRKMPPAVFAPPQYFQPVPMVGQYAPPGTPALQAGQSADAQAGKAGQDTKTAGLVDITSPMVGTFYRASSPGADPYVDVGSMVEPDTVVSIIEAMKVMNEIKAEVSGEIVEVCVKDAEPVEFGQVLFRVKPHSL